MRQSGYYRNVPVRPSVVLRPLRAGIRYSDEHFTVQHVKKYPAKHVATLSRTVMQVNVPTILLPANGTFRPAPPPPHPIRPIAHTHDGTLGAKVLRRA